MQELFVKNLCVSALNKQLSHAKNNFFIVLVESQGTNALMHQGRTGLGFNETESRPSKSPAFLA